MSRRLTSWIIISAALCGVLLSAITPAAADETMRAMQCMLQTLGYQQGPVSDTLTIDATIGYLRFAQAHSLPVQGEDTLKAIILLSEYAERVPASQRRCVLPATAARAKPVPLYSR